jgi:hypothetical protein
MPSERLRQLVADDYYRGHRHAVGGHVYTVVSTYEQYDAYIDHIWPRKPCASLLKEMLPNRLLISRLVSIGYLKTSNTGNMCYLLFGPN